LIDRVRTSACCAPTVADPAYNYDLDPVIGSGGRRAMQRAIKVLF
jgi:hypothetical protein